MKWIILILVLLVLLGIAIWAAGAGKRREKAQQRDREEAASLRQQAQGQRQEVAQQQADAAQANADAERARVQAEQQTQHAQRQQESAAQVSRDAQAAQEAQQRRLREADLKDPDILTDAEGRRVDRSGNLLDENQAMQSGASHPQAGGQDGFAGTEQYGRRQYRDRDAATQDQQYGQDRYPEQQLSQGGYEGQGRHDGHGSSWEQGAAAPGRNTRDHYSQQDRDQFAGYDGQRHPDENTQRFDDRGYDQQAGYTDRYDQGQDLQNQQYRAGQDTQQFDDRGYDQQAGYTDRYTQNQDLQNQQYRGQDEQRYDGRQGGYDLQNQRADGDQYGRQAAGYGEDDYRTQSLDQVRGDARNTGQWEQAERDVDLRGTDPQAHTEPGRRQGRSLADRLMHRDEDGPRH